MCGCELANEFLSMCLRVVVVMRVFICVYVCVHITCFCFPLISLVGCFLF